MYYRLLFALVFCFNVTLNSQVFPFSSVMNDYSINFYDACNKIDVHFDTTNKDIKGSGFKHYQRWKNLNEPNFFPTGDRSNVSPSFGYDQWKQFNLKTTKRTIFGTGWTDLGPYRVDSITNHYAAGLGRLENAYVDPKNTNKIYLASRSGGFWRSTNGGTTWKNTTPLLPASGVNIIAVSPWNSDSILINVQNASNEYSHGIYRSLDGGLNWTTTNFIKSNVGYGGLGDNFTIYKIHYHPRIPNLIFVGTNKGFYRSTNNLSTWSLMLTNSDITEIAFHPTNDSVVYMYDADFFGGNLDRVFVSRDFGQTFTAKGTLTSNASNRSIEFATSALANKCLWVASSSGVWISKDEGSTFTFLSKPTFTCGGFAINVNDTSKMCHGYVDMARSTDGGRTFKQNTFWSLGNTNGAGGGHQKSFKTSTDYIHADIDDMFFTAGSFYACTDGFLCKSSDNGITWQILSQGAGNREFYKIGTSQSNHYKTMGGSQDNGSSQRVKNNWVEIYGADGMEQLYHPLNENMLILSIQYGSRQSSLDGGKNLSNVKPFGAKEAFWEAPIAFNPNNPFEIYDFRDTIYKSTNFGKTHVKLGVPKSFTGSINHAEIAMNNTNIMVITKNGNIDLSKDGGNTFKSIVGTLPNHYIEDVAFDPKNDSTIIVVYGRYNIDNQKVYITKNFGTTWTNITHNLGSMPIRSVVIDHTRAKNIYVGAEIGIYTKPMVGTVWNLYNTNLPNSTTQEMEINWGSNTLKAATWGHGLWENTLVGRKDFPAILSTNITNPPTENTPKLGIKQFVTSTIHYATKPKSVFVLYGLNTTNCNTFIAMDNTKDSTWVSTSPLPTNTVNDNVFFKVFAVGTNNDTTETYRFMYNVKPYVFCEATGSSSAGNLYIAELKIDNIAKTSLNTTYANYTNPVFTVLRDSSYTIKVTANTSWTSNDYSAYIDYNKDADFDATETILYKADQGLLASNKFTVPKNILYGDTVKMRVRLSYWGLGDMNPCGTNILGEVEDYQVVLKYKPIMNIKVDNSFICKGNTVNYYTEGDKPDSIKWMVLDKANNTIETNTKLKSATTFSLDGKYSLKAICYFASDSFSFESKNCITVNPNYSFNDERYVCYGDSITNYDGTKFYAITSNFVHTNALKSYLNCDSIIISKIIVRGPINENSTTSVCSGESFTFADGYVEQNITSNFNRKVVFKSYTGCDSLHTYFIEVKQKSNATQTHVSCNSFTWIDGKTYTNNTNNATYTLVNSIGCDSVITLNLTINKVEATISKNNNILTVEPTNAQKYVWINCLNYLEINGAITNVYQPAVSGSFACIITNNNCLDTTVCTAVTLGLQNKLLNTAFNVYPNPTNGQIQITNPQLTLATFEVYNHLGKKVLQPTSLSLPASLNLTNLAKGNYFLHINSNLIHIVIPVVKD